MMRDVQASATPGYCVASSGAVADHIERHPDEAAPVLIIDQSGGGAGRVRFCFQRRRWRWMNASVD